MRTEREYYANLPRKRSSAGVLCVHDGKILLLQSTYENKWTIPGGMIEENESPLMAARRECEEEIGFAPEITGLACMDYSIPRESFKGDSYHFLFRAEPFTEDDVSNILLNPSEHSYFEFLEPEEALKRLVNPLRERVATALKLRGKPAYLEDSVAPI